MLSTIRVILVTGTIFLLSACGRGGGGSDAGAVPEPPSVIRISDTTLRDISPGDTFIYDLDGSYTEYDWDGVTVINSVDIDTTLDRACFSTQTSVNGQPALSMKTTFGTGESSTLRLFQDSAGSLFEYAENTEDGYVSFSSPPQYRRHTINAVPSGREQLGASVQPAIIPTGFIQLLVS